MMGEYITLTGTGDSLLSTAREMLTTFSNFLQTPEGLVFIVVVAVVFYLFKRSR